MADGKIVYEVRVDSSQVPGDIKEAETKVTTGMSALKTVTDKAAAGLGMAVKSAAGAIAGIAGSAKGAADTNITAAAIPGPSAGEKTAVITKGGTTPMKLSSGMPYVPSDDFPALLHKGEAVLTAPQNALLQSSGGVGALAAGGGRGGRGGADGKSIVINNRVDVPPELLNRPDPNVYVTVKMDGYEMARVMASATNELGKQLGTRIINN